MSITSVVNDTASSVSVINAQKPLPPTIASYSVGGVDDTALDPAGGQTVQINGTGFLAGATITFDGNAVAVVTYVSPNRLTFTSPAKSAGTYTIYVVNPDGGTAIYIPGIIYSVLPTWTTSAGSLGSVYETNNISTSVVASGDAPITYSLYSGSLPTGSTLYANGVISGTAPVDNSSTTYSFTIQATDAQLQDSTRSFSLTINTDVVTWVSPANATTYTSPVDSAIANVTLSATDAAGYAVSYSANALPTGLSLTGANISGTPTVIADSSTLLTATAATTNRTATRTINWSITVANDPYFEYNTLLIPGASTTFVDDASTNNFAVSIFGDTKPNSFNPYSPGYYSNYFAANEQLTSASIGTSIGTGDFSLECWVNVPVASNQYAAAIQLNVSTGFNLYIQTDSNTLRVLDYNNPIGSNFVLSGGTINNNTWYHLLLTRQSGTVRGFINGKLTVNQTGVTYNYGTAGTCQINAGLLASNISNARVILGNVPAAYQTSSTTNGTQIFTPSTTPLTAVSGTALLTSQSNRFIDNSAASLALTLTGSPKIQSFIPFTPNSSYSTYGSGYFDGTGDYLATPPNATSLAMGTGNFTIEFWINTSNIAQTGYVLQTDIGANSLYISLSGSTIRLTNAATVFAVTPTLLSNTWYHIAVVRSGTSSVIYTNGVAGTAVTCSIDFTQNGPTIGANSFIGYLSDYRIVKGTAVYTTAFTPPTAPLTAIANTQLLTLQNNQSATNSVFLDNSTNNLLVTRNGNATQGTFSPYGGNWSNYFDGTGGNFLLTTTTSIQGSDFTIEGWFYTTNVGSSKVITSNYQNSTNGWSIQLNTSNIITASLSGDGVDITGSTVASINTWYHFALCGLSGSIKLYLNGVQEGSTFSGATTLNSTQGTTVGGLRYLGSNYDPFYGYISNVRIVKGTAVYTANFTPPTTPLTAITNTSTLLCQSNRFIDNSINNYPVTLYGTVPIQRFSPFNPSSLTPTSYSGYFDGTGDYLSLASNAAFNFGSGDFTVEFWVYMNSPYWSRCFVTNYGGSTTGWTLQTDISGYLSASLSGDGVDIQGSTAMVDGVWYHVALSGTSGSIKLFLNGVQQGSTFTGSVSLDTSSALSIGQIASSNYLVGYMSNLRLVKGTALYTSSFTPPTSPLTAITNTSLLTCQSPTFIDNSTNNFTITAFGNSQPTQQNPFGYTSATTNGYTVSTIGGSGYFDGDGDYLTLNGTPGTTLSGNFTLEAWVYIINFSAGRAIICIGDDFGNPGVMFFIDSTGKLAIVYANARAFTGTGTVVANTWNHVAFVRTSGVITSYLNGVSQGTLTTSNTFSGTTSYIGLERYNGGAGGVIMYGYISDLRITNGMALYPSNFVPPAQPLTAIQNTGILTNMTSAGIYDAAMMTNMETVNDAQLSTTVTKFGSSSMSFDGSGDYLFAPTSNVNNLSKFLTSNFTVECWIYPTTSSGDRTVICAVNSWGAGANYEIELRSGVLFVQIGNGITLTSGTTSISANTWTHIALVRSGATSTAFYVNGVSVATSATNWTADEDCPLTIGCFNSNGGSLSNYWQGYIDDLRITKGYARYTSNFTPPTSAFPTY